MCNDHRRCPGCNSERGRAAHNARRRHNRAIKAAVVAHVRGVVGNRELADELEAKPPKAAKEWAEDHGLGTAELGIELHKSFRIEDQPREQVEGEQVLEGEVISPEAADGAPVVRPAPAQAAGARPGVVPGGRVAPSISSGTLGSEIVDSHDWGRVQPEASGGAGQGGGAGHDGGERRAGGAPQVREIRPEDLDALGKLLDQPPAQPAAGVRPRRAQAPSEPAIEPWQKSASLQRQITTQLTRQGTTPVERLLLDSTPGESQVLGWQGGVNETRRVDLGHGMKAYFKPFSGVDRDLEVGFGQKTPGQQQVHEAAAWRLAERMGPPYSDLVAPCVLREVDGQLGSLGLERPGVTRASTREVQATAPDALQAAGFFDALIGQQDRHAGNYLLDSAGRRLTLIDHGFSFATPGSYCNHSKLRSMRRLTRPQLTEAEKKTLRSLLDSPDTFGLQGVIESERLAALRGRAQKMLDTGEIVGEW